MTGGIVWHTFGWFEGFFNFKLRCCGNVGINFGSLAMNKKQKKLNVNGF